MGPVLTLSRGSADLEARRFLEPGAGPAPLSEAETALLRFLAGREGQPASREVLLREVWGYHARVVSRTVDTTIWRLRSKIERDPSSPEHLLTVPGAGWRLHLPAPAPVTAPGTVARPGPETDLAAAVAGTARWITLAGPGGAGKSTLLHGWAARAGLPVVDLAGVEGAEPMAARIAVALGWSAVDSPAALARALEGGPRWLLLDDLDRGVPAARVLFAALAGVPVRVLATSRERLAVPGEAVVSVGGMTPAEARALWEARRLPGEGWPQTSLAALLRAVDHLPLAVELVAGWTDLLGADDLLARLGQRLEWLRAAGDAPSRHADLRAVVDASWALLPAADEVGLRSLGVFEADFALADAEVLSPAAARWLREGVRRSLVERVGERFRLWSAVRARARELGVPGEVEAAHRRALVAAAEGWRAAAGGVGRGPVLAAASARRADLEALLPALARDADPGAGPVAVVLALLPGHLDARVAALRLATAAAPGDAEVWAVLAGLEKARGGRDEAREAAAEGLRRAVSDRWRAELLDVAGVIERDLGDGDRGLALLDEAVALARTLPDEVPLGRFLVDRSWALAQRGRTAEAEEGYAEALRRLPATMPAQRASALANLGNLWRETGRDPQPLLQEALAAHRAAGNRQGEGIVCGALAGWHTEHGDAAEAERWYEQALAALRSVGHRHAEWVFRLNRAFLFRLVGDAERAREDLDAAEAGLAAFGDDRATAQLLGARGELRAMDGDPEGAEAAFRAAVAAARARGQARFVGVYLGFLGSALAARGARDEAAACLDEAAETLAAAGYRPERVRVELRRLALLPAGERAPHRARWAAEVGPDAPRWLRQALDAG